MVRICTVKSVGPYQVTSVADGINPGVGWETMLQVAATEAPALPNGSRSFAVVVSGYVSNAANFGGQNGYCVEVSLWLGDLSDSHWHRVTGDSPHHSGGTDNAHPFFMVQRYEAWPTNAPFRVRARITRYGAPVVNPPPTVQIRELSALVFSLDNLGADRVFWEVDTNHIDLPALSQSYADLRLSSFQFPYTSGTDVWMVFQSVRYRPQSTSHAVNFVLGPQTTGGWTGLPNPQWGFEHLGGKSNRTPAGVAGLPQRVLHRDGAASRCGQRDHQDGRAGQVPV